MMFTSVAQWVQRCLTDPQMYRTIQSSHINILDHCYLQEFENQVVGELSLDHRTLPYSFILTVGK